MLTKEIQIEPVFSCNEEVVAHKLTNLFDAGVLEIFNRYLHTLEWQNEQEQDPPPDNIVCNGNNTFGVYNEPLTISILETYNPVIQSIMQREVLPSYTYCRVYEKGTQLISHRDRDSCEISMTLNLFQTNNEPEPFYVSNKPQEQSSQEDITVINSYPGEAIVFKGQATSGGYYHWRDPTKSNQHLQCFLHWVYADGKYKDNAFEWKK